MEGPENEENLNIYVYLNRRPPGQNKWTKSEKNYQLRVVFNRLGGHICWEAPRKALPPLDKIRAAATGHRDTARPRIQYGRHDHKGQVATQQLTSTADECVGWKRRARHDQR